ncbi:UNVERIFIED_ORG: hypothetical protein LHJ69_07370 [Shinella sp. XGS7]|nr:hypothetical protein [Shinella sp. XGS7]
MSKARRQVAWPTLSSARPAPAADAQPRSRALALYDLASQVTIAAAILYFWGTASLAGEATALDLSVGLMQKELWSTIAHGLQGAVGASFLLPVSDARFEVAWPILAQMAAGALLGTAFLIWGTRNSPHRPLVLRLWCATLFGLWIAVHSTLLVGAQIRAFKTCINTGNCTLHFAATEVSFEITPNQLETRLGVIQSSGASHLVLLTPTGVAAIPMAHVRLITTAELQTMFRVEDFLRQSPSLPLQSTQ